MPWRTWWRWACIRLEGFGSFEWVYLRYDDRDRSTTSSAAVKALDQARVQRLGGTRRVSGATRLSLSRGIDRNVATISPTCVCNYQADHSTFCGIRVGWRP